MSKYEKNQKRPRKHPLDGAPSYSEIIDNPDYVSANKVRVWREDAHRKAFPAQYDENGKHVRDMYGEPL